ncbi:MAG: hypothetical protein ACKON7_05235, partial [Planctomycetaceae bacterium]
MAATQAAAAARRGGQRSRPGQAGRSAHARPTSPPHQADRATGTRAAGTHTSVARHVRRPVPRWADEGACTTVEHPVERARQHRMLIEFLTTGRGIAFPE